MAIPTAARKPSTTPKRSTPRKPQSAPRKPVSPCKPPLTVAEARKKFGRMSAAQMEWMESKGYVEPTPPTSDELAAAFIRRRQLERKVAAQMAAETSKPAPSVARATTPPRKPAVPVSPWFAFTVAPVAVAVAPMSAADFLARRRSAQHAAK